MLCAIICPNGQLIGIENMEVVVEKVLEENNQQKRVIEIAKENEDEPNGIRMHGNINLKEYDFYIGNLKSAKVKELKEILLRDMFFDFSEMQYQEAKTSAEAIFDNGKSLPYILFREMDLIAYRRMERIKSIYRR